MPASPSIVLRSRATSPTGATWIMPTTRLPSRRWAFRWAISLSTRSAMTEKPRPPSGAWSPKPRTRSRKLTRPRGPSSCERLAVRRPSICVPAPPARLHNLRGDATRHGGRYAAEEPQHQTGYYVVVVDANTIQLAETLDRGTECRGRQDQRHAEPPAADRTAAGCDAGERDQRDRHSEGQGQRENQGRRRALLQSRTTCWPIRSYFRSS